MSGSFVWTLVLTDIASGWTECVPLLVREARLVVDAVDQLAAPSRSRYEGSTPITAASFSTRC